MTASASAPDSRIDATLRVAALEDWHNDLRGTISADVTSLGRWPNVEIHANAEASQVRQRRRCVRDRRSSRIDARDAHTPRGTLALNASGVKLAGFQFDKTAVGLEGDERSHRLKLDARGERWVWRSRPAAALERRAAWSGLLEKLRLEVSNVPPLALTATGAPCRRSRIADARHGLPRLAATSPCAWPASGPAQEFAANYSLRSLPIGVLMALAAPESPVAVEGTSRRQR